MFDAALRGLTKDGSIFDGPRLTIAMCVFDSVGDLLACVSIYANEAVGRLFYSTLNSDTSCSFTQLPNSTGWEIVQVGDNITSPAYQLIYDDPNWFTSLWTDYGVPGVRSFTGIGHSWLNSTANIVVWPFQIAEHALNFCWTNTVGNVYGQISASLCNNQTAYDLGVYTGQGIGYIAGYKDGVANGIAQGFAQGAAEATSTAIKVAVPVGIVALAGAVMGGIFIGRRCGQPQKAAAVQEMPQTAAHDFEGSQDDSIERLAAESSAKRPGN